MLGTSCPAAGKGGAFFASPTFRLLVCYAPAAEPCLSTILSGFSELKYDGFRSLAVIQNGRTQLISGNGHPFNSFSELSKSLTHSAGKTVLDGEIVCRDKPGKPQFRDLLFHRGEPCFFAFALLMSDGKDLRMEKLTDRKQELRRLMLKVPESRMHLVDHVAQHGTALFQRVCQMDLEGIVAKHSLAPYTTERTTWFKIKTTLGCRAASLP